MIYCQEFEQEMSLQKDHNYHHLVVFGHKSYREGRARKLPSHLHYNRKSLDTRLRWIFLMFEPSLSRDCRIFEHSHSNKSLLASDYCRHKAIVRVLESLLKVLLSFDNLSLIDSAIVFIFSFKLGTERIHYSAT